MLVEARALAKLGQQPDDDRRLISDAEVVFGRVPAGEANDMALGFAERQLCYTAGNAYTSLGLGKKAHEVQERARWMSRAVMSMAQV